MIILWAEKVNKFFSTVVRIQNDRGQTVCKDGPYRFVRHPRYLGGLLYAIVTPFVLSSFLGINSSSNFGGFAVYKNLFRR